MKLLDAISYDQILERGFDIRKREINPGDVILFRECTVDGDETTYTGRKHRCVVTHVAHVGGKRGWYVFSFKDGF